MSTIGSFKQFGFESATENSKSQGGVVNRQWQRVPERPRMTKIGTEVAHVTRDSDTTFKVKRSKVNLQGAGHIVSASRTACLK